MTLRTSVVPHFTTHTTDTWGHRYIYILMWAGCVCPQQSNYSKELSLRNQPLETKRWIQPQFLGNRLAGLSVSKKHTWLLETQRWIWGQFLGNRLAGSRGAVSNTQLLTVSGEGTRTACGRRLVCRDGRAISSESAMGSARRQPQGGERRCQSLCAMVNGRHRGGGLYWGINRG